MTPQKHQLASHNQMKKNRKRSQHTRGSLEPCHNDQKGQTQTCTAQSVLQRVLSDRGSEHIQVQTGHKVEGQRMYIVDRGAPLHMLGEQFLSLSLSLRRHRKLCGRLNTTGDPCPFENRSDGLHPGAWHSLPCEVGGRLAFGIVSRTFVRGVGVLLLLARGGNPTPTKGKKPY